MDGASVVTDILSTWWDNTVTSITSWWNGLGTTGQFEVILGIILIFVIIALVKKIAIMVISVIAVGAGVFALLWFTPADPQLLYQIMPMWDAYTLFQRVMILFILGLVIVIAFKTIFWYNQHSRKHKWDNAADSMSAIEAHLIAECREKHGKWLGMKKGCDMRGVMKQRIQESRRTR